MKTIFFLLAALFSFAAKADTNTNITVTAAEVKHSVPELTLAARPTLSTNAPQADADYGVPEMKLAATAETATNAPARVEDSLQTTAARLATRTPAELKIEKPNEIVMGNVTYEGIGVQLVKTHYPLQLINPFAPAKYGSPEDNVMRDPAQGRILGLKFLSIKF
jgi:hypothetical protein